MNLDIEHLSRTAPPTKNICTDVPLIFGYLHWLLLSTMLLFLSVNSQRRETCIRNILDSLSCLFQSCRVLVFSFKASGMKALFRLQAGLGEGGGFAMLSGEVGTRENHVSKSFAQVFG